MTGPERRPDFLGIAFGAVVVLALLAVVARVTVFDPDRASGLSERQQQADSRITAAPEGPRVIAERRMGGLMQPDPADPLYYDGPRDLEPAAAHEPAEIAIPKLGLSSALLRLDKRADNRMEVPGDFGLAGWYVRGPSPGQTGPAVIVGHLDSRNGPAIFSRLDELAPGDAILVRRGDSQLVRFKVTRTEDYDKDQFPTQQVYGNTAGPELRLITCGGEFDYSQRSYRRNLVVYAALDPEAAPPTPSGSEDGWVEQPASPAPSPTSQPDDGGP